MPWSTGDEFSVYIIDWLIPDMNGIEIVRQIRKVIGKSCPIIILTAYDWADIEEEARAAGVTAFCEKAAVPLGAAQSAGRAVRCRACLQAGAAERGDLQREKNSCWWRTTS